MKNVLILNGSPRVHGNTAALCEAFAQGCREQGHAAVQFNVAQMHIRGCLGCLQGGKDGSSPCVQKDDMQKIYPHYRQADCIVLASPMYYWGISGQLKTAFDRLFAVAELDSAYANPVKDCYLLMAAEGNSADNWEPVLFQYRAMLRFLNWNNRGEILAGGVFNAGDIKGHKALAEALAAGKAL